MSTKTPKTQHNALWKWGRGCYLALCTRFPRLRKVRKARWERIRRNYEAATKDADIDEKAVFFECFGGRQYTCSPRALYVAMIADERFDDWTFYWSFGQQARECLAGEPSLKRAHVVERGSREYFQALAVSKYWVINNRMPEYVTPRDGQVYVQCWHGTPLKRLGCDVPESSTGGALNSAAELAERFRMDSAKWTYLLAPSQYTATHLSDAFGLPEKRRGSCILVEGYPRNDFIRATLDASDVDERVADIKRRVGAFCAEEALEKGSSAPPPIDEDKKVLLYAPTFRDDQYTPGMGYSLELDIDLDEMRRRLGEEWVVLLRMHYYIANEIDTSVWDGFAYDVSRWPDINELYVVSDALCTDYSSVFFDYSNTGRPLYFLWTDIEHYGKELHGFYLDPTTLPGPKCRTAHELTAALEQNEVWHDEYGKEYEAFRREFCPLDDGHAAERVIERVFFPQGTD